MQPIPYEALPGEDLGTTLLTVGGGLLVAVFGIVFSKGMRRGKKKEASVFDDMVGIVAVILGFMLIALGLAPSMRTSVDPAQVAIQSKSVQKEVRETYGLKLSQDQAAALRYPAVAPDEKFKVYGSFEEQKQTEGKAFKARTVYLVWSDGSLGLSESSDGKSFTPLEPKA